MDKSSGESFAISSQKVNNNKKNVIHRSQEKMDNKDRGKMKDTSASEHRPAAKGLPTSEEIAKLPPDGGPEFNRLIHEKSPYLLQHARNPVDWFPWGREAFEKAKSEGKPVFLSIGYSTCHWCHVMERESFENEDVAKVLNEYYICIKVDREERPDIDEIYMNATQLITGRGGWPNSLWLLPDGRPWYGGTYFPPEDFSGRPGFKTLLLRLAEFWRTRQDEVEAQANKLSDVMNQLSSGQYAKSAGEPTRDLVQRALGDLRTSFDVRLGGFGGAPKFPPHGSLNLILYEYGTTQDASLLKLATRTLDAMAEGGIRDHVGGGFHRYSTDARWLLPHFEKMLYDNAQLARAYVNAYLITGNDNYRETAVEVYEWALREMSDEHGGFFSAYDADSEGVEGKFYLWGRDEIVSILGEDEGELFCRAYNIKDEGNFQEEATGEVTGTNIPHLQGSWDEIATAENIPLEEIRSRLKSDKEKLREHRAHRIWPHLDDKVLTSWNGLMISSLAFAGRHLNETRYTVAAERAADFLLTAMQKDGRLLRTYRDGEAKLNAYLDDYAFLADGLLELYEVTEDTRRLEQAKALMGVLHDHYWDGTTGGFFFTSEDHEDLLTRSKDPTDKAIPSGNGMAAKTLVRLGILTGEKSYLDTAKSIFEAFNGLMQQASRSTESLILALAMYFDTISSGAMREDIERITSDFDGDKPDAYVGESPVSAAIFLSRLRAAPGETFSAAIKLIIDEGWHINSGKPLQEYLKPTMISLEDNPAVSMGEISYPDGKEVTFPFNAEPLSVYEDDVWLRVPLTIGKKAKDGSVQLDFGIRIQPCNEQSCRAPRTLLLSIPIEIDARAKNGAGRHQKVFEACGDAGSGKGR